MCYTAYPWLVFHLLKLIKPLPKDGQKEEIKFIAVFGYTLVDLGKEFIQEMEKVGGYILHFTYQYIPILYCFPPLPSTTIYWESLPGLILNAAEKGLYTEE